MSNKDIKKIGIYKEIEKLNKKLQKSLAEYETFKSTIVGAIVLNEIRQLQEEIAWLLLECGEYEKGLELYKAMSWRLQGEIKYLGIGRVLTETGHFGESKKLFEKGLRRFPDSYSLLVGIGNLYHGLGDYSQSSKYFDRALKYNPSDRFILFNKGAALYGLGYYKDASSIFQDLTAEYSDETIFSIMMGYCYLNTGYPEDAAKYFKKLIEGEHAESDMYNGLYWAYKDMGLNDDAMETARQGLRKFPDEDSSLYMNMADACWEEGWYKEAKDIVAEGLERFPDDEDLRELLKKIEDEIDNPDDDKNHTLPPIIRLIALSVILKRLKNRKRFP